MRNEMLENALKTVMDQLDEKIIEIQYHTLLLNRLSVESNKLIIEIERIQESLDIFNETKVAERQHQ